MATRTITITGDRGTSLLAYAGSNGPSVLSYDDKSYKFTALNAGTATVKIGVKPSGSNLTWYKNINFKINSVVTDKVGTLKNLLNGYNKIMFYPYFLIVYKGTNKTSVTAGHVLSGHGLKNSANNTIIAQGTFGVFNNLYANFDLLTNENCTTFNQTTGYWTLPYTIVYGTNSSDVLATLSFNDGGVTPIKSITFYLRDAGNNNAIIKTNGTEKHTANTSTSGFYNNWVATGGMNLIIYKDGTFKMNWGVNSSVNHYHGPYYVSNTTLADGTVTYGNHAFYTSWTYGFANSGGVGYEPILINNNGDQIKLRSDTRLYNIFNKNLTATNGGTSVPNFTP